MPSSSFRHVASRREHDLPPRFARRLEDDDLVAAQRRYPGRLEPCRACSHHHHLPPRSDARPDHVRHRPLAAGRRVVEAEGVASDVDPVDAVAGADAGSDPLLLAAHHLRRDVRVGHVGAGHRHHVDEALAHAVLRRREVHDAGRVKDGEPGLALHPRRDVHVGRARSRHARNGERQPPLVSHLARDDVEEVAHAGVRVDIRKREAVILVEPAFLELVAHHPEADQEVLAHSPAHLLQDLEPRSGRGSRGFRRIRRCAG